MQILPTGLIRICRNSRGFSFLEIIIVMVIIGLMFSIVLPNFMQMFSSVEGLREGEKILHLFERARAEAIIGAEVVKVTFFADGLCQMEYGEKLIRYQELHASIVLTDPEEKKLIQTFQANGVAQLTRLTFQTGEGRFIHYDFNPVNGKILMERSSQL